MAAVPRQVTLPRATPPVLLNPNMINPPTDKAYLLFNLIFKHLLHDEASS